MDGRLQNRRPKYSCSAMHAYSWAGPITIFEPAVSKRRLAQFWRDRRPAEVKSDGGWQE